MNIHLVEAPIGLLFSKVSVDENEYLKEYHHLNDSENNAISHWLRQARAKGDTTETDPVLLNLILELHRKVDSLERFLKNEEPKRVSLAKSATIESIGFEHFKVNDDIFEEGVSYYGRVDMPTYPKRDIAIFFKAIDKSLAKITKIHEGDEREWGAYLTSRERALIREAKEHSR